MKRWIETEIIPNYLVWAEVQRRFTTKYMDSQLKNERQKKFKEMKMERIEDADQYCMQFQELARLIGYAKDDKFAVDLFEQSLPAALRKEIHACQTHAIRSADMMLAITTDPALRAKLEKDKLGPSTMEELAVEIQARTKAMIQFKTAATTVFHGGVWCSYE